MGRNDQRTQWKDIKWAGTKCTSRGTKLPEQNNRGWNEKETKCCDTVEMHIGYGWNLESVIPFFNVRCKPTCRWFRASLANRQFWCCSKNGLIHILCFLGNCTERRRWVACIASSSIPNKFKGQLQVWISLCCASKSTEVYDLGECIIANILLELLFLSTVGYIWRM
jgi:hypothetical protein